MNTALEDRILEQLHQLDERSKAEVLDFVGYLATKANAATLTVIWPELEPVRDLVRFQGALQFDEDAVAYQILE